MIISVIAPAAKLSAPDYALFISITAIVISIFSLAWNVWQKFLFVKPEIHVNFLLGDVNIPGTDTFLKTGQRLLVLTATNMGPGPVTIYMCVGRPKFRWGSKRLMGMLNPIHGNPTSITPTSVGPFSGGLPAKIEAGDMKSVYFPYTEDIFLKDDLATVGFADTYGKFHWCSSRQMRAVMERYRGNFARTDRK